jgi:A/G-specific adenine glycosylase
MSGKVAGRSRKARHSQAGAGMSEQVHGMTEKAQAFASALLRWFAVHGRHDLPWQQDRTPYRVWISEVMLQQTQVATVMPYYRRFMERFPNVESLAAAPVDEVLHLWTGLGYYARARNLHACARIVVQTFAGKFPKDLAGMMSLPGIGRSTAGAILSMASGVREPILDGNVKRVLSRVFGIAGDPSSKSVLDSLWSLAEACTPDDAVADYTQAIMDLGATLCTRARPACTLCPVNLECIAAREGRQSELPGRKRQRERPSREATLLLAQSGVDGSVAVFVERRPATGLWGGLWSPPQFEDETAALAWCTREIGTAEGRSEAMAPIDHAFTHFDLRLKPLWVRCTPHGTIKDGEQLWYPLDRPPKIGLPQPIKHLFERLRANAGFPV